MHCIVSAGTEDRAFNAESTQGWEAFRERMLEYLPERVARITGVPEGQIRALGERITGTRPTAIEVGIGMRRHGGGDAAYDDVRGFSPGDREAL